MRSRNSNRKNSVPALRQSDTLQGLFEKVALASTSHVLDIYDPESVCREIRSLEKVVGLMDAVPKRKRPLSITRLLSKR